MVTSPELKCPACTKTARRRQDIYSHYRHALYGWDIVWNKLGPHSAWAEQHGIVVQDGAISPDSESDKLRQVLYRWLSEAQE